jgi:hypothetical protein
LLPVYTLGEKAPRYREYTRRSTLRVYGYL